VLSLLSDPLAAVQGAPSAVLLESEASYRGRQCDFLLVLKTSRIFSHDGTDRSSEKPEPPGRMLARSFERGTVYPSRRIFHAIK
jgi:hypothetical protein